jgi:CheY-like chemotaxis protein
MGGPIRILIGEDDQIVALDMQRQLRAVGLQVDILAGTPREVISLARDLMPDVIVLDFNIEGDANGIKVAQQIYNVANIPIVFLSAYASDVEEHDRAIPPLPFRYITKPFNFGQLHQAIKELVAPERQR